MEPPRIRGLNHLTLAVTDLDRSVAFYAEVLGCELKAVWKSGAYLQAGPLWLCLSVDEAAGGLGADYTHYAFDVEADQFDDLVARVRMHAPSWKDNRSEGASFYFLDPDNHRLELHVGTLASRLAHYRAKSDSGVQIFD
ncbi:MAG: VOC family protein [Brevundimonas sp.]